MSYREVADSSGTVQARYDYDSYGNATKVSGSIDSDFQYAGYYYHSPSNLNLTLYRAYDPTIARWISRDPIEENGGINLYGYVYDRPINLIDPEGEDAAGALRAIGGGFTKAGAAEVAGLGPEDPFADAVALVFLGLAVNDAMHQLFNESAPTHCPGNKPPFTGTPGSTVIGGTGSRTYGDDGYPVTDRDLPHPDEAGVGRGDHSHDWGRPQDGGSPTDADRSPPRPPKPSDPPPPRGPNVPPPTP